MTKKDELRRLAQAASPGPWKVVKDHEFPGVHGGDVILGGSFCDYSVPTREDEEFIAAANPAVVLELLDEIERLRAEIEQARRTAEYWKAEHIAANAEMPVEDLAALVQRLVRRLRKAAPDDDLPDQAMGYLRRNGLLGSPLREIGVRERDGFDTLPDDFETGDY